MQQCLNMLQGDTKPIRKLVEVRFDEIKTITESKSPVLDMERSDWSVGEGGGQEVLPEADATGQGNRWWGGLEGRGTNLQRLILGGGEGWRAGERTSNASSSALGGVSL